ncbi:regulatory protein RecX [Lacibacterium aquatile]|uniref:Regulatory protein RecX n=1 Tax=Lacibacterium aquatile TaxID=1168082 RepID=A0ABW5DRB1_9PROT
MIKNADEAPEDGAEAAAEVGQGMQANPNGQAFARGLKVKEPTEESLYRFALWYLERFSATVEGLRKALEKRVRKAVAAELVEAEEGKRRIEVILGKMLSLGYLNDDAFADGKANSLLRAGKPPRHIRETLKLKGVEGDTIDAAMERLSEDTPDLARAAAVRFAQRKRIGFFRLSGHEENREKDLATLMRAGHSPSLAKEIVDADDDTLATWTEAGLV